MTNELSESEKIELLTAALMWYAPKIEYDDQGYNFDQGKVARGVIRLLFPDSMAAMDNIARWVDLEGGFVSQGEQEEAECELLGEGIEEAISMVEKRLIAAGVDKGAF